MILGWLGEGMQGSSTQGLKICRSQRSWQLRGRGWIAWAKELSIFCVAGISSLFSTIEEKSGLKYAGWHMSFIRVQEKCLSKLNSKLWSLLMKSGTEVSAFQKLSCYFLLSRLMKAFSSF